MKAVFQWVRENPWWSYWIGGYLFIVLFCSGCTPSNLTEAVKAQQGIHHSTCVTATTPWGKGTVAGTSLLCTEVQCNSEGMVTKPVVPCPDQQGPVTNLGVRVTPVGPGTLQPPVLAPQKVN